MDVDLDNLPDDADALRALIVAQRAELAEALSEIAELDAVKAERIRLEAEVERLTAQNERYEGTDKLTASGQKTPLPFPKIRQRRSRRPRPHWPRPGIGGAWACGSGGVGG
jgi:hypothetical protein